MGGVVFKISFQTFRLSSVAERRADLHHLQVVTVLTGVSCAMDIGSSLRALSVVLESMMRVF